MKTRNIILAVLGLLLIAMSLFLFLKRHKIVRVGTISLVEVNCNDKELLLNQVYESDQRIRRQNIPFQQFAKEDHRNQELVISLIERCGMPTLNEVSEKHMTAIWLALQHTRKEYRKKYFPLIEEAVKNGDLSKEHFALMKDRILMDEGKPQLYGSQVVNGKLYHLGSPQKVNQRRKEMGFRPIEEYLKDFDIEYDSVN